MMEPQSMADPLVTGAAPGDDRTTIEALLGGRRAAVDRVGMGRNSRVYRVSSDGDTYIAKFYFGATADGRDRLQIEFSALEFLWNHGVRCIPHPKRADDARKVALYSFVDGKPVDTGRVSADDMEQLLSFVRLLSRIAR